MTDHYDPTWMTLAICRVEQVPTRVFFTSQRRAATYCRRCPVSRACANYATSNDERFGTWGGNHRDPSTEPDRHTSSLDAETIAFRIVHARLPHGSEARHALRKLSRSELTVLARQEGLR